MEVSATAKYVRVQPRKVRLVAHEVSGQPAEKASVALRFHPSKGAFALRKVVERAVANAQENHNVSPDRLRIKAIMVDEGPRFKRIQARAMGRANRILKRTSHITVVVEDFEPPEAVKPHGTKAKPRPSLAAKKSKAKPTKKVKDEETATVEEQSAETTPVEEQETEAEATPTEAPVEEPVKDEAVAEEATADATPEEQAEESKPAAEEVPEEVTEESAPAEETVTAEPTEGEAEESNNDEKKDA